MTTSADDRLLRGIRIIRSLAGPPESPWPGQLAVLPSGETRVLVDAAVVGDDWAGWDAATEGHVAAPVDVVRVGGGHLIVMPVCVEPLADVVTRRESAGAELTDGERLTVAVSLLRGLTELAGRSGRGTWWVTEDARPVFAPRTSAGAAEDETSRLLRALSAGSGPLSDAIAEAAVVAADAGRLLRGADALEARLFELAVPEPLALTVLSPRAARGLPVHLDAEPAPPEEVSADASVWHRLARHVDADVADLVSRASTGVWRRLRRSGERRRRTGPWIVAAILGAVIVGGAALVPSAADDRPAVGAREASVAPTPSETAAATAHPASGEDALDVPAEADLTSVAGALLDARTACGADTDCARSVIEDPAVPFSPGPIDLPSGDRVVTLLDEFGGAAVLRVEAADASTSAQLIVIVRADARWLLRDVHDVAEKPS